MAIKSDKRRDNNIISHVPNNRSVNWKSNKYKDSNLMCHVPNDRTRPTLDNVNWIKKNLNIPQQSQQDTYTGSGPAKVAFGTTTGKMTKYLDRWLRCFSNFTYKDKICVVSSDVKDTIEYVQSSYPDIKTIYFNSMCGSSGGRPHSLVLMGEGKDKIRSYVCGHNDIEWLLLTDSDIECPPSTIEIFLHIATKRGFNVVYTINIGAVFFLHRDVCDSIHYMSPVCPWEPYVHIEENFEVLRQMNHLNDIYHSRHSNMPFKILRYNADWLRHQNKPLGVY